jgi:hypothetical protein
MSLTALNKPVTRSRKLISEKKTSKKAEMPKKNTTAVKKKENPKATQNPKPVVNKPTEKASKAFGNKRLLKGIKLSKPVIKEEIKQKSPVVILPKKVVNTEQPKKDAIKIGSSTIIEKTKVPNDEQQKTKDEKIKKKSEPIILNKMKFGQNAHRAIIQDRDTAVIIAPRLNEKIRKATLAEHGIDSSSKGTNVKAISPTVNNAIKLPAKETIAVWTNKSMIDFICEPDGDTYTGDTSGIIITMTSWPKRIKNVEKTLKTILENSVLPEKIIVNLSTEEFPGKESNLPSGLILLAQKNPMIEFHWLKHNTTVWKKIIPTIIRFKNANVICIDDDRLYPKNFIATFKEAASKYPSGPITGANISFHKKFKQHCGHATLDKYAFYKDGLDFITREVMDLKSSDSVLTIIANRTGHPTQYLGTNYLSLIPQNNNPVDGYSSNGKVSVSASIKSADTLFDRYLSSQKKEEGKIDVKIYTESYGDFEITYAEIL